jgi:hypothetical protein
MKFRYGTPEDNTPTQFHTAFAGTNGNGLRILWQTDTDTPTHVCKYGLSNGTLTSTATGISRTYGYSYTHVVTLSGLQPFTKYYYSCGDATYGFGPVYAVNTARKAGDATPHAVAVVGDMGVRPGVPTSNSMISKISSFEWVQHVGDLGYADDAYLYLGNYEQTYSDFMNQISPLAANMAYMGLPGNHEATCNEVDPNVSCDKNLRNFSAYRNRWAFPDVESGGTDNMWYSFDYGLIHWVQIDTETDFPNAPENPGTHLNAGPFGDQLTWLKNDLTKAVANRAQVPWIIVSGHRPIFYSGGDDKDVKSAFLSLLDNAKVDFYWCGHEHNYERYYPITTSGTVSQKNYDNPQDIIYFVNGAGGNVEGHSKSSGNQGYIAYQNDKEYGWALFTLTNRTTLKWEFYSADSNTVVDSATITKNY